MTYRAVVKFSYPNCLRVIVSRGEVLYPEDETKDCEDLGNNLGSIVGQYVRLYSIWNNQMFEGYCRYLGRADFHYGDCSRQFREPD